VNSCRNVPGPSRLSLLNNAAIGRAEEPHAREGMEMLAPTRILVPTDFSEYSGRALQQALDIAQQNHAKIFLLHVVHEVVHRGNLEFTLPEELVRRMKDGAVASAEQSLHTQLHTFLQTNGLEVVADVRYGIPCDEILKEEKEKEIDLVIIASPGSAGLARHHIGNVARGVLKHSTCPVLLT